MRAKDALIAELKERVLELAPLENRVIEEDRALKILEARLRSTMSEKEAEIAKLRKAIEKLKPSEKPRTRRTVKTVAPGMPSEKTGARDDLKTISGIGPAIERTLNRLGVRTYRQIAKWTKADIDRVSARLTAFKDRIRRENWVTQARKAHLKKYGKRH
jgi:predicted flap endonuclease-1-like 5' DNA nuclease